MASRVLISMFCLAIAGCGGDAPPTEPAAKPATVAAPVKEAQLTTVTLSEEAEKRLAIKTEAVAQRAVPRTRTIGGEIVAPSGTALAITAPVSGTLQAASVIPTAGLSVTGGYSLVRDNDIDETLIGWVASATGHIASSFGITAEAGRGRISSSVGST